MGVVDEQQAYYQAIAGEYEDHKIDVPGQRELLAAVDAFRPTGDVLELACGSGAWTARLAGHADWVTAIDGAPGMLDRARARLGLDAPVDFVHADLFAWQPTRRYDTVFFGFWISHVPDEHFDSFWVMIDEALAPGGTVFFFDDNYRPDQELVEGPTSSTVERRLKDGTAFRVIKVPYAAAPLEARLRNRGWDFKVTGSGNFYWGEGGRSSRTAPPNLNPRA